MEKIKTSERLRDYDWKEELEMIHHVLETRLSILLTNIGNELELISKKELDELKKEAAGSRLPDESEYLFHPKQNTNHLIVFNIPKKKFTDIELDFAIPYFPGFCHVKNEFYLAGG